MTSGQPRLLLISYHFPPMESAGAVRWESMVRHAERFGYGVDVVTALPESWDEGTTSSRLDRLPEGTGVTGVGVAPLRSEVWEARMHRWWSRFRNRIRRQRESHRPPNLEPSDATDADTARVLPHSLAPEECRWLGSRRDLLRHWWTLQDHGRNLSWAREAGDVAREIFRPGVHRALITCGPPHAVHLEASRLSRSLRIPHILDLRDPWAVTPRVLENYGSPLWWVLTRRSEREAVGRAAMIAANTEPLRKAMLKAHPDAKARFITVMNGWDEDEPVPDVPNRKPGDPFRVVYTGEIYLDRSPDAFLRASRSVIADLALTPDMFQIAFLGPSGAGAERVKAVAAREGIERFVTVRPRVPREEALREMAGATMLLSLGQDSPYAIPSKVFEYLRFTAWNLVLATPESPTGAVLSTTGVDLVMPDDAAGIARVLRQRLVEFRSGRLPPPVAGREQLARGNQARVLFDELDTLLMSR